MKVLVACEESQRVCIAFLGERTRGIFLRYSRMQRRTPRMAYPGRRIADFERKHKIHNARRNIERNIRQMGYDYSAPALHIFNRYRESGVING